MTKYVTERQKQHLINAQTRAKRKIRGMQQYREDASLEIFGFSETLLDKPKRLTVNQYKKKMTELAGFISKKNRLVNIGTKEDRKYIPSSKLELVEAVLTDYNRFVSMRQKSLKAVSSTYYTLDENGNVVIRERETPFEQTEQGQEFRPIVLQFVSGKQKGYVSRSKKDVNKLLTETIAITKESDIDRFIKRYENRATSFGHARIQQLEDNYFKGLAERTSNTFAKAIRKQLDDLGVDAIDFLFLFDTTAVFDFKFIYDTKITIADVKEELVSEVEKLKTQGAEGYKEYRKIVSSYEKTI